MLVRMLVLAPILPALVTLALVVLGIIPRLRRFAPATMFTIFVAVEIEILLFATLLLPSNKFLDQALDLSGLVIASTEVEASNALGALVAFIPAGAVPALIDKAVGSIRLRLSLCQHRDILATDNEGRARGLQRPQREWKGLRWQQWPWR